MLEYTETYGFSTARAELLESHRRYNEAAEMHLQEGRISEAIRLFMVHGRRDSDGLQKACDRVLSELWDIMSLGVRLPHDHAGVRRLFALLSSLPKDKLHQWQRHEVNRI